MIDRYDSYFQTFYIKLYEAKKEIYTRTKNNYCLKQLNELRQLIKDKWLIELDKPEPKSQGKQYLLF